MNILNCDLCGFDAGNDPYHATMDGNGHVHICTTCFDPQQHDVGVLKQQRDELIAALKKLLQWMPVYPKAADAIVGGRESYQKAVEASRAAIAKTGDGS